MQSKIVRVIFAAAAGSACGRGRRACVHSCLVSRADANYVDPLLTGVGFARTFAAARPLPAWPRLVPSARRRIDDSGLRARRWDSVVGRPEDVIHRLDGRTGSPGRI